MKVTNISNSYQHNTQFKSNPVLNAKKGLLPLVLAGGLLMAQPAKSVNTENFYPENEYSIPSGEMPMKFLKGTLASVAVFYGFLYLIGKVFDFDNQNQNKETASK